MAARKRSSQRKARDKRTSAAYVTTFKTIPDVWDVAMFFSTSRFDEDAREWLTEPHSAIAIPWPVAKQLCFMLASVIRGREYAHGPIHVPAIQVPNSPTVDQVGEDGMVYLSMIKTDLFQEKISREAIEAASADVMAVLTANRVKH